MRPAAYMIVLATASISASLLFAAEPAPKPPAAKSQSPAAAKVDPADKDKKAAAEKTDAEKKADAEKDKTPDATEKAGDEKSAADKSGGKGSDKSSPQRFIPSEQVRADFDVSFPVDI